MESAILPRLLSNTMWSYSESFSANFLRLSKGRCGSRVQLEVNAINDACCTVS